MTGSGGATSALLGLVWLLVVFAVCIELFEMWMQRRKPHARCGGHGCRFCDNGRVYRSVWLRYRRRKQ